MVEVEGVGKLLEEGLAEETDLLEEVDFVLVEETEEVAVAVAADK